MNYALFSLLGLGGGEILQGKRDWPMTKKQQNIYQNLWNQVHSIFDWRTHHQGKRGNERYRDGLSAFCKHLAIHYRSKNFRNISNKHLASFVEASKKAGVSASTIKTDLAAIRKLHSLVPKTRYKLSSDNKDFQIEKRKNVGVDRAWRDSEVKKAIEHAKVMGRKDVEWAIGCARTLGLRIEEVTALTKTQIREALMNGYIHLTKTKGGIKRDVPLNEQAEKVLRDMLAMGKNEKIFIEHGRTHKQAMKSIQNWIYNHRHIFTEKQTSMIESNNNYQKELKIDYERPNLTFHGLRHAFAREQYHTLRNAGKSPKIARKEVSRLLGHGRDDVTRIYLG